MSDAVRVIGPVQHYAWGDPTFIPELLGIEPDGQPWAELWLGTHPNGPATLESDGALDAVTGPLPYLLKVLSAAAPLSLQVHPSAEEARAGHERGDFPDPNAKPELLVALTRFEALCGFRPVDEAVAELREHGHHPVADLIESEGYLAAVGGLLRHTVDWQPRSLPARLERVEEHHPGDPGVGVAFMLNHVVLRPGQALHLTANNLHAYLSGSGIELMGASDNVVRGGLTVKEVDVDLLLDLVDPTPLAEPLMAVTDGVYPLPEAGVALVRLAPEETHASRGHELAVSLDGTAWYLAPGTTWTPTAESYVVTPLP